MPRHYRCITCHLVYPIADDAERRCTICGDTNGEIITDAHLKEGFEAGAYFNIDLRTGGRAKAKKRR
jgi:hypothetical protein